jgi:soluble lytic murein transglycosylase-like protein
VNLDRICHAILLAVIGLLALSLWLGGPVVQAGGEVPATPTPAAAPSPDELYLDRLVLVTGAPFEVVHAAVRYGRVMDLEPELLLAMARVESTFNPAAQSHGCMGLYQVRFSIWRRAMHLDRARMLEVDYNTWAAARILDHYRLLAGGDLWRAVHLYNNGPGGKYDNREYAVKVREFYKAYKEEA